MLISSSKAMIKAAEAGVTVIEATDGGNVVGLNIGGKIVRHNGVGWYEATEIDAAIGHENIAVTLTAGGI